MRCNAPLAAFLFAAALHAAAADFAAPGGPVPANIDQIENALRRDAYDMELLISFGTSKGGSAGHLALALRDDAANDDIVWSANFYADRAPAHEKVRYTDDLMTRVPKKEYLFGTSSILGEKASFGLDFGELYKRSVVAVRVAGVPREQKEALAAYFRRMNDDYRKRARDTEYHDGEVVYDYFHLNCAKTIGAAFKYGAGYKDLAVTAPRLGITRVAALANANIPMEMGMKLVEEWAKRGYTMDVVLYRKYRGSAYVDPHEEEKIAFKDLPNRFPSVKSLDFRNDDGEYEDYDNLYALYLLHNLARYAVRIDGATQRLEIDKTLSPLPYAEAATLAAKDATDDATGFLRRLLFKPRGKRIDAPQ